ncbi:MULTISPECIES: undecaprenyl-phosphate glucose phosphotransferase [Pseudoalteromonas]|uniref:undecaprenyl-phosphate glucose phosphotransferase n=1 Tax=Pseudoalteromonas TaxID=53246 RepID=UPI0006B6359D|nr:MULTISPECIES: undecaprenyl-phosphate glucose phosphotransferase [Pseudoalteromonas]TMO46882.1 undecaprenyl-phosphate glucose phosphotransferase [Pseudoalteromonas ruthenica]TMO49139.1 undecaprenyl-phosphate glucose phosphotransferase [Pseudoalteromonas ruthenica]GAP75681.1 capsular polysaccharide synthesis enzyme CpsA, sugar transferase [Pseudoalteromonas sp. SW0106-04]
MTSDKTFKNNPTSSGVFYRLMDLFSITAGLFIAASIRGVELDQHYLVAFLILMICYLYTAEVFNVYRSWRAGKFQHMVSWSWLSLVIASGALFIFAFGFKFSENLSRLTLFIWFLSSFIFLFSWRLFIRLYKVNKRKLGFSLKRVAIIGATESGANLFREISQHDELGFDFVGFFEDRQPDRVFEQLHFHVQGAICEAVNAARRGEVDVLFIALPMKADKRIADILRQLGDTTVDVHFVPDFLLSNLIHARIDHVGGFDTLSVFESPYLGAREFIKRSEDIVVAALILLLISPLLIAIAIAIKLTSAGPVLFVQDRYGLGGERIRVWKFRSMKVMENDAVVRQATKNDARITPIGGFLRRTSLDELPQFFNVLFGDMSIVGPRPHAVAHNEEYRKKVEFYMIRHKVKPGITGWAQINGWRGETDTLEKMEKRVEFDLQYIKSWSLWFDIKIIFMTIFKGFVGKNAY